VAVLIAGCCGPLSSTRPRRPGSGAAAPLTWSRAALVDGTAVVAPAVEAGQPRRHRCRTRRVDRGA
jgi:hypothetical protein